MLKRIHLENFKACQDVDVRIAGLTVVAGLNSSGKSSLMQSVALLRQSYAVNGRLDSLLLSGDLVHLGHGKDVLSERADSKEDSVVIDLETDSGLFHGVFNSDPDATVLKQAGQISYIPDILHSNNVLFLQADRVIPTTLYPQRIEDATRLNMFGPRAEYTADYLAKNAEMSVSKNRLISAMPPHRQSLDLDKVCPTDKLLDQVAGWLQHLSPGVRLQVKLVDGTDEVLLQYNYVGQTETSRSNYYRPTNVGFGLTYSFPIIVSALAAPAGSLLMLENPEAHLHPVGQAAVGQLLSLAAADGVQVIVETHSDHVLNGIRLAVKQGRIRNNDVALHFFERRMDTGETFVQSPAILPTGKLSDWPVGFFDQWDKSLEELLD